MLNEYMRNNRVNNGMSFNHVKGIECNDGFTMSVQASDFHYCSPKVNNADSYTEVEIGFPSQEEELLLKYAEDTNNPTGTVYGYVPVKLVEQVITKHGGIKGTI